MGALLVIAYKVEGRRPQILVWIGINVVLTFTIPNISWQGHLGGLLGGMAIAAILVYAPRQRRTQVQVAGLVVLTVLLVAAIVARTASLTDLRSRRRQRLSPLWTTSGDNSHVVSSFSPGSSPAWNHSQRVA